MTTGQNCDDPTPPGVWYKRLLTYLWYDCLLVLYISLIAIFKEVTTRAPVLSVEEMGKKDDHVAVITGGPRGLALGLIKRLTQLGFTIILGVRDVQDSQTRLDEFIKLNSDLSFKVKFSKMDLTSLSAIREFADIVLAETPRIDLLLCNAAIMWDPYKITEDGFESQFQVNFLSHFLLTLLLQDKMKETAKLKGSSCKVIYTSSIMYQCGKPNFEEFEKSVVYTPMKFYCQSKLHQIIGILALEKRTNDDQVHFAAVHPGFIPTDMWYHAGGNLVGWFGNFASKLFRTVENAADTILWPAFSPKYQDQGGLYFESGRPIKISAQARNEQNQLKLYERSVELIQNYLK